jgi:UDP-N-acetylmuramyl pentapeptide synthase
MVLDDLKRMGETNSAARAEVARLAKTLDFDRCAMLGEANPMMRYGTNLMLRAIGRSNVKFFASQDAALMWLGISEE